MLMCSPEHFDVSYAINAHMTDEGGALRRPDPVLARKQWDALRREYESIGYATEVLPGEPGLPDMTFAANPVFPFRDAEGLPAVLVSRMRHPERSAEPGHYERWFAGRGYRVVRLPESVGPYEGAGDLLWHPGRRFLYGGHGFRTTPEALRGAADAIGATLLSLRLVDPRFYHLDTAFVPLDEERALFVPEAFDESGRAALAASFPGLISVPVGEAAEKFACNAHCPDGRNVLIEAECTATKRILGEAGFRVRPAETSEFRKAGGSVFCLKAELP
jgi:N-dimethylarginine dimethylaminohydrolase